MIDIFIQSLFIATEWILSISFCLSFIKIKTKKTGFLLRLLIGLFLILLVGIFSYWGMLYIQQAFEIEPLVLVLLNILFFTIGIILFIMLVCFCYEISLKKAMLVSTFCYAIEHISRNIILIIKYFLPRDAFFYSNFYLYMITDVIALLISITGIFFIFFKRHIYNYDYEQITKDNRIVTIAIVNIFICTILSSFRSYVPSGEVNGFTSQVICSFYGILCCLLCLYILINYMTEYNLEKDKRSLDIMIKRESEKNLSFSENIEILHIQLHDLKKKIHRLEEGNLSKDAKKEIIEDFNQINDKYQVFVKTGSAAIDGILSNLHLTSLKENVDFTYFVDGKLLDFMETSDAVALFDNLLSNSFEAVKKEKTENKIIHFEVFSEKQMILINIRNYTSKKPKFENDFPITDKDNRYHGYGMKSIKRIVEKYNGEMHITYSYKFFAVKILFPDIRQINIK